MGRRQAGELLCDIAGSAPASFEALKLRRSKRVEVCALVHLSLSVGQPLKSRVRKLLQGVVRCRNMTWPSGATAHSEFSNHTET